jgi:phosphate acyltransferase
MGGDVMRGDVQPQVIYDAVKLAASTITDCHFVLFAPEKFAKKAKPHLDLQKLPISFEISPQIITMQERPLIALKAKPNSSLVKGVKALHENKIDAFISCGNTGALIAASVIQLSHLPGSTRAALLATLPTQQGSLTVLDVGGNVVSKATELVQFAHLGSAYHRARYNVAKPKLALLNIGVESEKGTKELKEAYRLLQSMQNCPFSFKGNVEGRDVFAGGIDVLVTSGFAGNVFLKTAEGVADFVLASAEKKIAQNKSSAPLLPIIQELKANLSYEVSQGALIAGVDGIVIKCHGNSTERAIYNAILGTDELIKTKLIDKMRLKLTHY